MSEKRGAWIGAGGAVLLSHLIGGITFVKCEHVDLGHCLVGSGRLEAAGLPAVAVCFRRQLARAFDGAWEALA
jgi:hypothetical protein